MKIVINGEAVEVPGGGSAGEVYSTEETRIGTWIDGKPLYRRVIVLDKKISSSSNICSISDWGPTIDALTRLSVSFKCEEGSGNAYRVGPDANTVFGLSDDKENIRCYVSSIANTYAFYAFVEYTKTTDEGGTV